MTKIKMLKNTNVALDGIHSTLFKEGCEYTVNDEILNNMIHDGVCEIVEEKAITEYENKAIEPKEKKSAKSKSKKS